MGGSITPPEDLEGEIAPGPLTSRGYGGRHRRLPVNAVRRLNKGLAKIRHTIYFS
jgi:hypothetical protein